MLPGEPTLARSQRGPAPPVPCVDFGEQVFSRGEQAVPKQVSAHAPAPPPRIRFTIAPAAPMSASRPRAATTR
jgi:hypothetical protein